MFVLLHIIMKLQETLKKKRLQVQRVIDKLMENYSLMREKSAGVLPALCITKK